MKLYLIALLGVLSISLTTEIKLHKEFEKHYSTKELNDLKNMSSEDIAVMNYGVEHALSQSFELTKDGIKPDLVVDQTTFKSAKSYLDLGLRIKANKTQFIHLSGTNLWARLTSFERLKIEYKSENRKK